MDICFSEIICIILVFQSPEKLISMKWQDKIEENTSKIGAKFIDYRPETGSWVFEVYKLVKI